MSTETKTRVAWQWCCQQPSFTSQQLQDAAEMKKGHSNKVITRWVKAGVIERIADTYRPASYRVVNPQQPPVFGKGSNQKGRSYRRLRSWRKTQQQKMWNTMLINCTFGQDDLVMTCGVNSRNAHGFIEKLISAGYVKVLYRKDKELPVSERKPSRYQLVRDTGRHAPICRENGCWDQNEQRLYPFLTEESEHGHVA